MKLLELTIEHLSGVENGTYSFGDADSPRDVVVLAGDDPAALLELIASLVEAVRHPGPTPHRLAWWANWRGPKEARLSARWALTEGEAALAGLSRPLAVSEWRFGPQDALPRELVVEGALPWRGRADLARYLHVNGDEIGVWMEADPLAELLARIARRDVAATRVACRPGVGVIACQTPDTLAMITKAVAPMFPGLRLERVSAAQGEAPVACFRESARVEMDQLPEMERNAIHLAAAIHAGGVRGGVALVSCPELPAPPDAPTRWLEWATGLTTAHELQLIVAAEERGSPGWTCHKVVELGADAVPEEHVRGCTDCQENLRIVGAIRTLYSGVTTGNEWQQQVLARIDELEAQRRQG
jgi:hypothetical protein